jgi:hypothetical protein
MNVPGLGMSRRHFLRHMTAAGMTLPMLQWLSAAQAARAQNKGGKSRSMILLWMSGGPSTIDLWDLKPGSANGGEFSPIDTVVPDLKICEHLPNMAKVMNHLNVIRSFNSRDGAHQRGTYILHTAFPPLPTVVHPAIGAVTARFNTPAEMDIPGHISLGGPGVSPGFLGMAYAPFRVTAGPDPIPNLDHEVADTRFRRRVELLDAVETGFVRERRGKLPEDHQTIYKKTFNLMGSKTLDAFKIDREDPQTIERYGDSQFGRDCLLARRLVEIGVPFVEVGFGGWDNHQNIFEIMAGTGMMGRNQGGMSRVAQLDRGFSALIGDLVERGLLETTTICWMGDFGRTPRINQDGGRDHWPACWSVVLGGGGMTGGQVIGATDADGTTITDRPVEVSNLFATLYQSIGIDPATELRSPNGRPLKLVGILGDGQQIKELI